MDLKRKLTGKFIVFDGPDGSGKTTQIGLAGDALSRLGLEVVYSQDPGGTAIGERIRGVLLDHDLETMDVRCETLLFMASRAQLVGEVIEPAVRAGKVVLCDRFISATIAYQGAAGFNKDRIIELGHLAVGRTWPELTLVLDFPAREGLTRTEKRANGGESSSAGDGVETVRLGDAMESRPLSYHEKVRSNFLHLPDEYPGVVEVIDGRGEPGDVHARIMEVLQRVDF